MICQTSTCPFFMDAIRGVLFRESLAWKKKKKTFITTCKAGHEKHSNSWQTCWHAVGVKQNLSNEGLSWWCTQFKQFEIKHIRRIKIIIHPACIHFMRYLNSQSTQFPVWGYAAQLVVHCTGFRFRFRFLLFCTIYKYHRTKEEKEITQMMESKMWTVTKVA